MVRKRSRKTGLPPGTLVHVGETETGIVRITIIDYDEQQFKEKVVATVEECLPFKSTPTVTWINIDGIHQMDLIAQIGKQFELHPLILEDIVDTNQRPKMEDFGQYMYIVLNMLDYDTQKNGISTEQVSMVLGPNFVISFQETIGDVFGQIRDRIRKARGRIRKMSSDYLAYSLIDAIVDHYFAMLEKLGDNIGALEEDLLARPDERIVRQIHRAKGELILLRKSIWPLREMVSRLQRSESPLMKESTGIYLRDVYDHTVQIIDTIESFRDIMSGMIDLYLSSVSNRMNSVMKVLTIIATIFIPLTFITGVYGMNFKHMPELDWPWAYPAIWLIMAIVAITMLVYFRKKKWL